MSFLSGMSGACDSSRSIWTRLVPYAQAYRSTWPRMSSGQRTRRSFTDFWCGGEVGAGTSLNVGWRTPGNGFYLAECDLNAESQRRSVAEVSTWSDEKRLAGQRRSKPREILT